MRPSKAKGSEKTVTVDSLRTHRLFATLAMVLALVFAGSNLSSAIDRIQHAPGAAVEHEHLAFSSLSAADHDHDADHHSPPPHEDDGSDHMMGGHHHHADGGSPLLAPSSAPDVHLSGTQAAYAFESTDPPPRLTLLGPERPPRPSHMFA